MGRSQEPCLVRRSLWGLYIGQFGIVSTQWFFLTWFPTYLVQIAASGFHAVWPSDLDSVLFAFLGVLAGGFCSDWMLRRGMSLTIARKAPDHLRPAALNDDYWCQLCDNLTWLMAFFSSAFFGSGCASITWSLVATMAPAHLIGLTGGVFNFFGNLAAIAIPIAVGALVRGSDFTRPLIFVAATALTGRYLVPCACGQNRACIES